MAVSRDTSNGPGWKDVIQVWEGLQYDLTCWITVKLEVKGKGKFSTLTAVAEAWDQLPEKREAKRLASASVDTSIFRGGDMHAALVSVLYELDRDYYRRTIGFDTKPA